MILENAADEAEGKDAVLLAFTEEGPAERSIVGAAGWWGDRGIVACSDVNDGDGKGAGAGVLAAGGRCGGWDYELCNSLSGCRS